MDAVVPAGRSWGRWVSQEEAPGRKVGLGIIRRLFVPEWEVGTFFNSGVR